jgi:hypothetical protein
VSKRRARFIRYLPDEDLHSCKMRVETRAPMDTADDRQHRWRTRDGVHAQNGGMELCKWNFYCNLYRA